jgi:DNA repair protein RadC
MNKENDLGQTSQLLHLAERKVLYQNQVPLHQRPKINGSKDAEHILRSNWGENMELLEEFNVLFLSRASHVKGMLRLSRGGLTGTVADPRILFAAALKGLATGIIVAHNHPSGCHTPSNQDIELTKKIKAVGQVHHIPLLDHIILAPHSSYYSFADEGTL